MIITEMLDYLQCDAQDQGGDCPVSPGVPLRGPLTSWSMTREDTSMVKYRRTHRMDC